MAIPNNCQSERIVCGDPSESGTQEVSLKIEENKISSLDTAKEIEIDPADFFNEKSKLWKQLVKTFCLDFTERELKPNMVGACWSIFLDEIDGKKGITKLAGEDDGGEFHNRGGCMKGTFYIRYQHEEDDEFYGERVLGF